MLAMHKDGLIVLPSLKWPRPPRRPMVFGPDTEPPPFPAPTTLDEVRPLSLRPVARYMREGKRWNEFVARYHYLGYKTLVGAQMRYAVHDRHGAPAGPPATARRLDRALQHHARAHRDLRRDPALHRRLVQGVRLDSRRNHQGTGPIRPTYQTGSTEEGHLAPTPAEGPAAHSQPVRSWSSVSPYGPPSRRDRTKTPSVTPVTGN